MKEGARYFLLFWRMAEKHLIYGQRMDILPAFWAIAEQFGKEIGSINLFSLFKDPFKTSRHMVRDLALRLGERFPG